MFTEFFQARGTHELDIKFHSATLLYVLRHNHTNAHFICKFLVLSQEQMFLA